jgi:hypothetical protein
MHTYLPGPTFSPAFAFSGSLITNGYIDAGIIYDFLLFHSTVQNVKIRPE